MARRWTLNRRKVERSDDAPMTAAATLLDPTVDRTIRILREAWQQEVWGFYHTQGEYRYAVDWAASAISRVRLRAAVMNPGADEPDIIETGKGESRLASEIVDGIGGGIAGQSALLSRLTVLLQVPGDAYGMATGEPALSTWTVHSPDTVKASTAGMSVQVGPAEWRQITPDEVPVRVHNSDPQFPWLATSPSQAVAGVLNEIDLYNRHIITTLTSRLASNGILIIPQEVSFPGLQTGAQAPNALISQLIELAKVAIKEPGSAGAAIPLVLEVPAQYADAIRHVPLSNDLSQDVIDARDKALTRLARSLNVPAEVLTGVGGVNHWGAWQIEDSAIKIHLSPIIETICGAITIGYLRPALIASGMPPEEVARHVVWYDLSELRQKTDVGERAVQLHDRVAISDAALREAGGFDESAAPTDDERTNQILTRLAYNGQQITTALTELSGIPAPATTPTVATPPGNPDTPENDPTSQVPDTIGDIPEFRARS